MKNKRHLKEKPQPNFQTKPKPVQVTSEIQTAVAVRSLAKEASRIVTDSDWDEMKNSISNLDAFDKEYSEWSRALYSVSISFFIFCVTLLIEDSNVIKKWYFYIFVAITLAALVVAIVLMRKGDLAKNNIQTSKNTLNRIIRRIEKKSEGLNIDYSSPIDSTPL